jgi:hypothetical protein
MKHIPKELCATLENGDQVRAFINSVDFHGYKPVDLWQLSYNERVEEPFTDADGVVHPFHYVANNTEYFPVEDFGLVYTAFGVRLGSVNPVNASGHAVPFDSFMVKDSVGD